MPSAYPPASAASGGDLYDDRPMGDKAPPDEMRENQDNQATGVLPKAFFQGKDLKPGTVCEVRIDRVMDDEVAVTYVPHGEEEKEEARPEEAPPEAPPEGPPAGGQPGMFD